LKISYFVTGGMAVLVWGRPRFTADIDIIVEFQKKDIKAFAKALESLGEHGYIDEEMMKEAVEREDEFNFIDGNTGIKVDFWILKDNVFNKNRIKRKISRKILDHEVYFISPEDLILSKLVWGKDSPSTRHLEDSRSVIEVSRDQLDEKYLKSWAKQLNVLEELNKIWQQ